MSDNKVPIEITADGQQADATIDKLGQKVESLGDETVKTGQKSETAAKKSTSAWKQTIIAWNQGTQFLGSMYNRLTQFGDLLSDQGKKITQYNILKQHPMWLQFKGDLQGVTKATAGAVHEFELLNGVNKALAYGMDLSGGNLMKMVNLSRKIGAQMGMSVQETFDRLVRGTGKREIELLDELGVTFRGQIEAQAIYAKHLNKTVKELTAAEQAASFFQATMIQLKANTGIIDLDQALSNIDRVRQRAHGATENMKRGIGEVAEKGAKHLETWLSKSDERFQTWLKNNVEYQNKLAEEAEKNRRMHWGDSADAYSAIEETRVERAARAEFDKIEAVVKKQKEAMIEKFKSDTEEAQHISKLYSGRRLLAKQYHKLVLENSKERGTLYERRSKQQELMIKRLAAMARGDIKQVNELRNEMEVLQRQNKEAQDSIAYRMQIQNKMDELATVAGLRAYNQQLSIGKLRYQDQLTIRTTFKERERQLKLTDKAYLKAEKDRQKRKEARKKRLAELQKIKDLEKDISAKEASGEYTQLEIIAMKTRLAIMKATTAEMRTQAEIAGRSATNEVKREQAAEKKQKKESKGQDWFQGHLDNMYNRATEMREKMETLAKDSAKKQLAMDKAAARQKEQLAQMGTNAIMTIHSGFMKAMVEGNAKYIALSLAQAAGDAGGKMVVDGVKTMFMGTSQSALTFGLVGPAAVAAGGAEVAAGTAMMAGAGAATKAIGVPSPPGGGGGGSGGGGAQQRNDIAGAATPINLSVETNLFGSKTAARRNINDLMGTKGR